LTGLTISAMTVSGQWIDWIDHLCNDSTRVVD